MFYPMVEKELSSDEHNDLLEEFRREEEKAGSKIIENSQKLLQEMGTILVQ